MSFHLLRPEWLLAVLPVAALLVLGWRHRSDRGGGWEPWVDAHLLRHLRVVRGGRRRRWPLLGLALLWSGLVIALAGPSWSRLPEIDYRLQREPLVIVLDLSRSMNAADPAPSRLEAARQSVRQLLGQWTVGEVGLVAFAATAHRVLPLTEEGAVVAGLLDSLDPELMPAPHSQPSSGLRLAHSLARGGGGAGGDILLVTDGSDKALVATAQAIRKAGVRVSVLAVGNSQGGDGGQPPTGPDAPVDSVQLAEVARQGGGMLLTYPVTPTALRTFIRQGAVVREAKPESDRPPMVQWRDQGGWLVLGLLPFWALLFRKGWLLSVVLMLGMAPPPALAMQWEDLWRRPDQQAMRAWERGDYAAAERLFRNPLWKGMARYRLGDYLGALESFSADGSAVGHFNRGVTLMRLEAWEEARSAFGEALRLEPGNRDAQFNRSLLDWYLSQALASRESREPVAKREFESTRPPAQPKAIEHQEAPMVSTSPDREEPGALGIPEEQRPRGSLGGAAILLEQAKRHDDPESDTAGEARSAATQGDSSATGSGQPSPRGAPGDGERAIAETSSGESSPSLPGEARADAKEAVSSEHSAGDPRGEERDAEQTGRASETAESENPERRAGTGHSAGRGGLSVSQGEQQQALEQWLAGLPSDARELLQREFRRNYERARPDLEGVAPW